MTDFNILETDQHYTNPKTVSYETPGTELSQTHDELFEFYDLIREHPEQELPSYYEQSGRVMLDQVLNLENLSFARLFRRAIIATLCCFWSLSASIGRLADIAVKKKELLIFSE